ncbi:MAG: hypothetical protein WB608_01420 [Terracidiphilus sp.]
MKKFGDVVCLGRNNVELNALVVQSHGAGDNEQLTVVFLDPSVASGSMGGMMVDKAISRAFATPLKEGLAYGWKELPEPEPAEAPRSQSDEFVDNLMPHLIELSHTVAQIAPDMEISPDGTLKSANTLLTEILLKKPEPAPSAADLDAHAEEQKAAEATSKPIETTSTFMEAPKAHPWNTVHQ